VSWVIFRGEMIFPDYTGLSLIIVFPFFAFIGMISIIFSSPVIIIIIIIIFLSLSFFSSFLPWKDARVLNWSPPSHPSI
jgi:hypothetical protein